MVNDDSITANLQIKSTAKKATKFAQIETLKFEVHYLTENILRFKITDAKNKRYEVPVQQTFPLLHTSPSEKNEMKRKYSVEFSYETSKDNFHFSIVRKDSKAKLYDLYFIVYSRYFKVSKKIILDGTHQLVVCYSQTNSYKSLLICRQKIFMDLAKTHTKH